MRTPLSLMGRIASLCMALVACAAAGVATAAEWRPLFDGKRMGEWKATRFGGEGEVAVVDGAIQIGMGADLSGITWGGEFPEQSYEISLEARRVDGNDFFCGLTFPVGDEACSLILGGWGGAVTGLSSIDGRDASDNGTTQVRAYEANRWYEVVVRVTPERIECFIDGEPIVDQPLAGHTISIRGEVEASRPLGISTYATTGEVRKIRWRPLGPAAPPNIILVLADDLGVNDLGCYGRKEHRTPQLDALAAEGMRFTCGYTAQPICSPSRAALMTGKCPARLHLTNFLNGRPDAASQRLLQPTIEGQLPLEETTLAEWLRGAGYATGMFGKWHLGGKGFGPAEQGFDIVMTPPQDSRPGEEDGGKSEYAITKAATEFITANRDRPFFCYVPHNNPHIPLVARQALVDTYGDTFHPTYAAMIETLDDAVGRLVRTIDELGLADNTIIIFTSDNGGLHAPEPAGIPATHNTPYRAGKGFLYEGGLREPLIVRWPGVIRPGSTTDTPVVLTDLVPTLLEAAGIDVAKTVGPLDGVSLMGLLKGGSLAERPLFWHFPNYTNQGGRPAGAMRQGTWKVVEQFEDGGLELYDLANDIGESHNLVAEQGDRARAMQRELAAWRARVGAQMGTPNPGFDPALHKQLYLDLDPSRITAVATAVALDPTWAAWREKMAAVVAGTTPPVTPPSGDVRLHAKDAIVHGKKLRYEPASNKNVLGFWTDPADWAEWKFPAPAAGLYEIEVQQGCGRGSGGAQVDVEVGGKTFPFTVVDTGHFQQLAQVSVGTVELSAGEHTLALRPRSKPGVAVMDVRRVVLRPVRMSR